MICLASSLLVWTCIALAACKPLQSHHIQKRSLSDTVGDLEALQAEELNEGEVPLKGCKELKDAGHTESGLYRINLNDGMGEFVVFCDMTIQSNEGWTIIQRRVDDALSFDKPRKDYNVGFGNMKKGNFWLGLEKIKRITDSGTHELYFGLESFLSAPNQLGYSRYASFGLGTDSNDYTLSLGTHITAESSIGDSFGGHGGEKFSTPDEDNDDSAPLHCADDHNSGWWFHGCLNSNMNGVYYSSGTHSDGIRWNSYVSGASLKTVVMAVRPA